MTRSDRNSSSLDDAQVEEILHRFFAREVPAEFRTEVAPAEPERPATRVSERPARSWALPGVAALAIMLAASALWIATVRGPHDAGGPPVVIHADPLPVDQPLGSGAAAMRPVAYSLSESVKPVESLRYDSATGPVEQRTRLNTTNVSIFEPETGELLELTVPELVIEIFPIDDAAPASGAPDVPATTPSLPMPELPEAKLPEQG